MPTKKTQTPDRETIATLASYWSSIGKEAERAVELIRHVIESERKLGISEEHLEELIARFKAEKKIAEESEKIARQLQRSAARKRRSNGGSHE